MKRLLAVLALALLAGCATVPDEVRDSLAGDVESWRLVKSDLVLAMPDGDAKTLWKKRVNAFIVRARANLAWAEDADEFDVAAAMMEEER